MQKSTKWTVVGAASVLGLGVASLGAVSAANALNFVTSGTVTGVPGISVGDERPSSGIPSASSALSATSAVPVLV